MTGNVRIQQVLIKRGNTAAASTYTGPLGELLIDTGLRTLRIQDGATAGGWLLANSTGGGGGDGTDSVLRANVGGYYTWANANVSSLQNQLTAANIAWQSNAATQLSQITAANAAIVTANTAMQSYVDAQTGVITTAWTANAATQTSAITGANAAIVTANTALKSYTDTAISTAINNLIASAPGTLDTLNEIAANLASEASAIGAITNSITAANAAIVTANTALKSYVDTQGSAITSAWTSNAATQASEINTLQANVGSFYAYANLTYGTSNYANANVAAYLVSYSGNIALDNITNTADSNVSIISSKNVTTDYVYTNGTDFSTDVDIGGGTIIHGWSQRNSEQIEIDLFVPGSSVSFFTGMQLGRAVIITYSTNSGNQTLSRTLTQAFTTTGQVDPNSPGGSWGRVAGRVDATLPSDQTGIVSINFPLYSVVDNNWLFDTDGKLTFPNGSLTIDHGMGDQIVSTDNIFVNGQAVTISGEPDNNTLSQINLTDNANVIIRNWTTVNGNQSWNFGPTGNLSYPDGTIAKGNVTYSPTTAGTLNSFQWKFSDSFIGNETVTLQWNLLDTTQGQWYLSTNDQDKQWVLDSDTQKLGFANVGDSVSGTVTFGTAAKGGTGNLTDIELTSPSGNAYIRANTKSWNFGSDGNITLPAVMSVPSTSPPSTANGIKFYDGLQTTAWTGIAPIATRLSSHDGDYYFDIDTDGNVRLPGNLQIVGDTLFFDFGTTLTQSNSSVVIAAQAEVDEWGDWQANIGGLEPYTLTNTPDGATTFANVVINSSASAAAYGTWISDAWFIQQTGTDPLWISPAISAGLKNQLSTFFAAIGGSYYRLEEILKSVDLVTGDATYTFGSDGNITMPWHGNQHDGHIFNLRGLHAMGASTAAHIDGFSSVSAGNIVATSSGGGAGTVYANGYYWGNGVSILTGLSNADVTAANAAIQSLSANIGGFYTWANTNFGTSSYSNSNVAAYLVANPQSGTYSNANVVANLQNFVTNIVSTANITAGNLIGTQYGNTVGTTATFSGNVTAANIVTTGATSGNISGANWISANTFQVSNGIFWANGTAWSSGAAGSGSSISNGSSSLAFASSGSNGVFQIAGVQTATFSQTAISMIGNISATANITAANIVANQFGNSVGTTATYSGNITAANIVANQFGNSVGTTATYSGNITAANIITTGTYGNITNANVISANSLVVTTTVRTVPVLFAALPSAAAVGAGARAFITDANTFSFASAVTGGGSYYVPIFSNGANWFVG